MENALRVLNQLEAEGYFDRYAIGGAVGAIFYMEPFLTYDLDVIIALPSGTGPLISLAPLYDVLRRRGYHEERECVMIAGVPVQFLPAYNPLVEEALAEANCTTYEQTPTRVLRAEHLVAIMVQTGRDKDRQRFTAFLSQAKLDADYLEAVLTRHGLLPQYQRWSA